MLKGLNNILLLQLPVEKAKELIWWRSDDSKGQFYRDHRVLTSAQIQFKGNNRSARERRHCLLIGAH